MEKIRLAICHCKTRVKEEISKELIFPLKNLTGLAIDLITFKSWQQEDSYAEDPDAHLYLASPDVAYRLINHGYKPIGTTEAEKLHLLKLPNRSLPKNPIVAISGRRTVLTTLFLKEPELFEAELLFTTCPEAEKRLKEERVDLIIVPKAISEKLVIKAETVKEITCVYPHILMVREDISNIFDKNIVQELKLKTIIDNVEQDLKTLHKQSRFLEEYHRNRYITEHILEFPDTFIAIYRDTFVFANECVKKLTGYTERELYNLPTIELVADELKGKIKPIIEKRLNGEKFKKSYRYLKLKRKDGSHFYLLALTDTIIYQGDFAGLVFGINVTKYIYMEKVRELIKSVNNAIVKAQSEEELFKLVCQKAKEHLEIELAWIGFKDDLEVKVLFKTNPEVNLPLGKSEPAFKAMSEGKVIINTNTREQPEHPWKTRALELNLLSSAYIPIIKWGEIIGVLALYSSEPFYFDEEQKSLLEELKTDLSIGIERLSLQRNLQLVSEAVERVKEIVIISEPDGKVVYTNPQAKDTFGLNGNKISNVSELLNINHLPRIGESLHTYCAIRSPSGKIIHLEVDCHHITLSDGSPKILITAKDVTKEALLSREIDKLKYTDPITELPNTNAFSINVNRKLKEIEGKAAMMVLHLRGLPQINFNFGFKAGDALLKEATHRLTKSLMKKDLIARLDGSKFGILITDIRNQHDLFKIVKRIIDMMELPFKYRGEVLHIIPSLGISIYPDDGEDFYTLYKSALAALHIAKKREHSKVEFFNKELKQIMEHFTSASQLVKEAVEKGLFVFYYQPYFRADDLSLAGFEALVRIVDENGTIHHPAEFIDYLENSIYNNQFQRWAIEKAVEKIRDWNTSISINISGRSFLEDDFLETINTVPDDVADKMVVEITERIMLKDINRSKRIMQKMKPKIKIAIDDFGTGYSSLLYLRELPADILKIDMQFIKEITKGKRELGIVKIIVDMAHTLGMEAVAEGVETKRHLELLREIKCDYLQGFYLARPMPEEEAERLIRK